MDAAAAGALKRRWKGWIQELGLTICGGSRVWWLAGCSNSLCCALRLAAAAALLRNRLKESLDLFEGIINLPWFKDAPIILFLNKDDLFRRKIESVDIGIYFPQYTGGTEYSLGLKFIQDEYFARNLNENKTIYWSARGRSGQRQREGEEMRRH